MRDVEQWLEGLGLGQYATAFAESRIDFEVLVDLTDADLKELGIAALGDRKKLLKAIATISSSQAAEPAVRRPSQRLGAERRHLTVMFCDLVDSTALSQRLDPEDLGGVIGRYQSACAAVVTRFDGYIAKYLGDGILAFFGYPHAHEDDAERAVRAGLEVLKAIATLPPTEGVSLGVRIGIATGDVVVGKINGVGDGSDQDIVGDTPNLAARLQSLSEPNTVVVAPATYQLLGNLFDCVDVGIHELKGFSQPVQVRRVLSPKTAECRFQATRISGLTPLVGREAEVSMLLYRWQQAKDGEGQVALSLQAEPGCETRGLQRYLG
jgi:class 3 adenylate cyclase